MAALGEVRPSRVIYVENDPALRGIMTGVLSTRPEIDLVLATGSAVKALEGPEVMGADVALLDVALGADAMDGIALGCALRARNADIGLVLHSQHPLPQLPSRVPVAQQWGWSTLHKRVRLDIDELVNVLVGTASGIVYRDSDPDDEGDDDPLSRLSSRQRQIMSLLSAGWDNKTVAESLGLSLDVVRQDTSRAYRALVPDPVSGRDVRTTAVLIYLRHARGINVDPDG
ncbi:MAG: LuxR C-terminal-related transcriptional regulator [Candidatus Nanopelagicales bacterium]